MKKAAAITIAATALIVLALQSGTDTNRTAGAVSTSGSIESAGPGNASMNDAVRTQRSRTNSGQVDTPPVNPDRPERWADAIPELNEDGDIGPPPSTRE